MQHRQEQNNDGQGTNVKRQTATAVCLYYLNKFYYFLSLTTVLVSSSMALLNSSCAFKIHCGKISIVAFQLLPSCCMVKKNPVASFVRNVYTKLVARRISAGEIKFSVSVAGLDNLRKMDAHLYFNCDKKSGVFSESNNRSKSAFPNVNSHDFGNYF